MRTERCAVRGNTVMNVIVCLAIAAVLAVIFPMFVHERRIGVASPCESNLKQIGNAMKMYLTDWSGTFPTNRPRVGAKRLGAISSYVELSQTEPLPGKTDPPRFQHGANWVEALQPYVEAITKSPDPMSAWRCPQSAARTEGTSYVMNRNLVEKSEGVITCAANLMLIRESDRLVSSELRPLNDSTGKPNTPPISPFLTRHDPLMGDTEPRLHSNGSHILFADGHVKIFDSGYFPAQKDITKANCWDPVTGQWYNYVYANPKTPEQNARNASIVITP